MLERMPEYAADIISNTAAADSETWLRVWPDNMNTATWYYLHVQEATNSHDYHRLTGIVPTLGFTYEHWDALLPPRDWTLLEKMWSEANS